MVCVIFIFQTRSRACLKKAFRELRVPVCGRFYPNEGGVAGYGNRMRVKYTAKWGLQIAEMIFQTRSRACLGLSVTVHSVPGNDESFSVTCNNSIICRNPAASLPEVFSPLQ